jgi:imidazoleglycerol-phosphate dehydratase
MQMRVGEVDRKTKETSIQVKINLDGSGIVNADTKIPFFDHMLNAFGKHGGFDLDVVADGDLEVDFHHTIEDIGIVLGLAIEKALGDKTGIERFAYTAVPMDEAIAHAALDISGRPYLVMKGEFSEGGGLSFPSDLIEHFFYSLCTNAKITLHLTFEGRNDHHMCEALFKAFGIALKSAVRIDPKKGIPSTKGSI